MTALQKPQSDSLDPQQEPTPVAANSDLGGEADRGEDEPEGGVDEEDSAQPQLFGNPGVTGVYEKRHPILDGTPCDQNGYDLPEGAVPSPHKPRDPTDYSPFKTEEDFLLAELFFIQAKMKGQTVDNLMALWPRWLQSHGYLEGTGPFNNAKDLYQKIDDIPLCETAWKGFNLTYRGHVDKKSPKWKTQPLDVWYRDPVDVLERQIYNPTFVGEVDYAPKKVYSAKDHSRIFNDLMSGDWAWKTADDLAQQETNHGAMLAPFIVGSDKTVASVATGQNEFHPVYISLGNVRNAVRRAHVDSVTLLAFLAIPSTTAEHKNSPEFKLFSRQVFHESMRRILSPLVPWSQQPRVVRCSDGHWRRVIVQHGPYIADYPEQCLVSGISSTWCPRCVVHYSELGKPESSAPRTLAHKAHVHDACQGSRKAIRDSYGIVYDVEVYTTMFGANIHELIAPDILHQLIKGVFKDHLVDWIVLYLKRQPGGAKLLAELDRRVAAAPQFTGIRRFHEGRGFKQWTGDDSKALMKVFLPAIIGLVPDSIVKAVRSFLEFCYLIRSSEISSATLQRIDEAIERFQQERECFVDLGIRTNFNLPKQHCLVHYHYMIQQFGAPNGLCTSITESKHGRAVKGPYRRSSANEPLGEILIMNQRIDKLLAFRDELESLGMLLEPSTRLQAGLDAVPVALHLGLKGVRDRQRILHNSFQSDNEMDSIAESDDEGSYNGGSPDDSDALGDESVGITSISEVRLPKRPAPGFAPSLVVLSANQGMPDLADLIRRYLFDQQHPDAATPGIDVAIDECPQVHPTMRIKLFYSATAIYHTPSDASGAVGMMRETIRANPKWWKGGPRYDCVFVLREPNLPGFSGLDVAQVEVFLSFEFYGESHACALVRWFCKGDIVPDPLSGLWKVQPEVDARGRRVRSIIPLDSIVRAAHLMGECGSDHLPEQFVFHHTLQGFRSYFVNKYIDYHAHEIAY